MNKARDIIETVESQDNSKRWQLLRHSNGFFVYEERALESEVYWVDADRGEREVAAETYWSPTHVSGLFDTSEAARADAIGTLPWLQAVLIGQRANGG